MGQTQLRGHSDVIYRPCLMTQPLSWVVGSRPGTVSHFSCSLAFLHPVTTPQRSTFFLPRSTGSPCIGGATPSWEPG